MNLVALSESGYSWNNSAALSVVQRISNECESDAIVVDFQTVKREIARGAENVEPGSMEVIPFGSWLKDGHVSDDIVNSHAIRVSAGKIPAQKIIVVDASAYSFDLISSALEQARHAWYPLEKWHPTFAIICEESKLNRLIDIMANTFYVQPKILTIKEAKSLTSQMMVQAFVTRWFGLRVGKLRTKITNMINAIIKKTQSKK